MENKNFYQAELFSNRLKKKYREIRKWARRNGITSYRIYDRDIPEIPLSLDVYEFLPENIKEKSQAKNFFDNVNKKISENDPKVQKELENRLWAVIYLYERPYEKDTTEEEKWLSLMAESASRVLNVPEKRIIKKMRKSQKGLSQYEKNVGEREVKGLVYEQGEIFAVDLSSYIDTGLFLDHRPTRLLVKEEASQKRVLNLFCYTGSFSVYAAEGGASYVESVDLSNTYLSWAKENMTLNGFSDEKKYIFTKSDAVSWLSTKLKAIGNDENSKFDIIILDPPTFSNSKSVHDDLDINRDWKKLVENCVKLLKPKGTLFFSTNSNRLSFAPEALPENVDFLDITQKSIPRDFERKKCHRCWKITVR